MKFSKWNNPSKKRKKVRKNYTDRCIDVTKGMLIDKRLGYNIPIWFYNKEAER